MLASCGVTAVSQTAGPETVLCGEAQLPYALVGYVTDYANGVMDEATPVEQLTELMGQSTAALGASMAGALALIEPGAVPVTGTHISWQ
jgi:5'-methylthioadenosine phosphorylase